MGIPVVLAILTRNERQMPIRKQYVFGVNQRFDCAYKILDCLRELAARCKAAIRRYIYFSLIQWYNINLVHKKRKFSFLRSNCFFLSLPEGKTSKAQHKFNRDKIVLRFTKTYVINFLKLAKFLTTERIELY